MIVADTGAMIALMDRSDRHHASVSALYADAADAWLLPWAILPEVDYLVAAHLGEAAQRVWLKDLADGAFIIEWGREADLRAAEEIHRRYRALRMGLVDALVIAVAERVRADAIATLDLRHFGAVQIKGGPKLLPRDDFGLWTLDLRLKTLDYSAGKPSRNRSRTSSGSASRLSPADRPTIRRSPD